MDRSTESHAAADVTVLIAELIHDTAVNGRPVGVRSASLGSARWLLFAVGEVEVMLQVSPRADGGLGVAGQGTVADIPLAGVPVRLDADGEAGAAVTGRGGGFWFPASSDATCQLTVSAHGYEIRTAPFRALTG